MKESNMKVRNASYKRLKAVYNYNTGNTELTTYTKLLYKGRATTAARGWEGHGRRLSYSWECQVCALSEGASFC